MSNGKAKTASAVQAAAAPPASPSARPSHIPPLFRPIDWLTFGVTTLLVWLGYYLTLAPDLGLEDSGELAVASYYAGIPHPPGYPVWTIYTWLWTVLLPFKNIAWRVALGEATAGAVACGLLGFLVSRGSSMMIEGIADLKNIERRWENIICVVSGFVAGTLLGFNGYMWSQSVIVEVYPALWNRNFPKEGRTSDQQDAYSVAAWLRNADFDGTLAEFFKPELTLTQKAIARVEGWILGIK